MHIYTLEIRDEEYVNGVSRYVEMLIEGLQWTVYRLTRVQIVRSKELILPQQIFESTHNEIILPYPNTNHGIINEPFWIDSYYEELYRILAPLIECGSIIHIQTMNLINLAVMLKKDKGCKIVSHIHCIPWKFSYTTDMTLFNYIYNLLYIENTKDEEIIKKIISRDEQAIAKNSDAIICVTKNAVEFVKRFYGVSSNKLFQVYNGLHDMYEHRNGGKAHDGIFRFLFVGNSTEAKGLDIVLKSFKQAWEYNPNIELILVGGDGHKLIRSMRCDRLPIVSVGQQTFDKVLNFYRTSDVGVIMSRFEECSYVAIEMLMCGLPIIYGGIETLDEVIGGEKYGMRIPIAFTQEEGLNANSDILAQSMINLAMDNEKRKQLCNNSRMRYLEIFSLDRMIRETLKIYNSI